jgi:hypothetical protein
MRKINRLALLAALIVGVSFCSCKKENKERSRSKTTMSFKMNGTEYTFDVAQFDVQKLESGAFRIISIQASSQSNNFPYFFDIRKSNTQGICGVLIPKGFQFKLSGPPEHCNLPIPTLNQNGDSVSVESAFYYASGTFDYSKSNCGNKTYFELSCLCNMQGTACDVSGTFNLTFKNGFNETITLTDGNFFRRDFRE